jgi:hypothetical protein
MLSKKGAEAKTKSGTYVHRKTKIKIPVVN